MMREESNVDLGAVKIHRKALAEIALTVLNDIEGVSLVKKDAWSFWSEILGSRHYPGISVDIDKNNQVDIEVKVRIRYGLPIPDVARQIQDSVRAAIEKAVDIDLREVHVNIYGIERGE